ncbi:MAG: M15 family metallopeptidase [Austwickia sp.]|jgi:hypothetical protein|nr:M15 family metallopeptidase [Austwickia sp.]MBK8437241.1 M15 family metallopeptidase [Austwickia sp.]MBK9102474.1 M15 family metallopeptidase [Austwickia sp.]
MYPWHTRRSARLTAAGALASALVVTFAATPVTASAAESPSGSAAGAGARPAAARLAYGADPRPRDAYDDDGWGSGYAEPEQLGLANYAGGAVRVRKELAPLLRKLLWLTEHVYGYRIDASQSWGYARRTVRGGVRISNHGRGLAIDLNAGANPMGADLRSDLPPRLIRIWEQHGFDWGGYYRGRKDAMHFEFADHIDTVDRYFASARALVLKHERLGDWS